MELSSAQIKRLRAEGHRLKLKPVVTIGQKGLGENLHNEIETALNHHELLKLRIPGDDKSGKRELASVLCEHHQANLVEAIGNVIVIYRCNPETDRFAKAARASLLIVNRGNRVFHSCRWALRRRHPRPPPCRSARARSVN